MTPVRSLVEEALGHLRANYIFPEMAEHAASAIRARLAAGEYDDLDEPALADRLTGQLYELCKDKHLRVRVTGAAPHEPGTDARLRNFGLVRVERLDGNVGHIELRGIANPHPAGRTIAAAMELVAHTHALIFDLRRNGGGSPDGVIFWNSFLFPDGDTHLNSIYDGASGRTKQYWSLAHLPGERYLDRPVYVLTSSLTFSAGEEFCYNLKAQGRAILIGETTAGGAHPTDSFPVTPTLEITVPDARSVNPVTGTNWEGTGVEPDIAVAADEAFAVAYHKCLQHVLATSTSPAVLAEARAALADADVAGGDSG